MAAQDLPQQAAIRRFQALLDSLDHPHDPEYHWLRNERRHPAQTPLHASRVSPQAPDTGLRRRVTDHWYDETT
jgi:hypothetical protein